MAGLRQYGFWEQPTKAEIIINENHDLLLLTKLINWEGLIELAMNIRQSKIKRDTGPQPHFRELLGAVVLMAIKGITFREAEDLIAHYAPARYLCDLMDSTWWPDHITIFDFTQMLGSTGMEEINKRVLVLATEKGFLDPSKLMADTTAQEAKIPYPTEVGLMSKYVDLIKRTVKKTGKKFTKVKEKIKKTASKIKGLVRNSHLFAKTKEEKRKVAKKLYHVVMDIHKELKQSIDDGKCLVSGASKELGRVTQLMERLLPQMIFFIEKGFVASKKIIHLQMSELYSIVRGKAGKKVEFGLKWGISRIGSGFVQGFTIEGGKHFSDKRFCLEAIKVHKECFGKVPKIYGFDRGGYSAGNIKKIKNMEVKHVGIAPKGKEKWAVSESMQKKITRERAQVEGSIGTLKTHKYGFNKPDAKSTQSMQAYGHRGIFGFNLMKMVRIKQQEILMAT